MKVSELIEALKQIKNQDALVIMSSDAEGNSKEIFSGDIEVGYWCPEERDTVHPDTIEEIREYDGEEEAAEYLATKLECITLWP